MIEGHSFCSCQTLLCDCFFNRSKVNPGWSKDQIFDPYLQACHVDVSDLVRMTSNPSMPRRPLGLICALEEDPLGGSDPASLSAVDALLPASERVGSACAVAAGGAGFEDVDVSEFRTAGDGSGSCTAGFISACMDASGDCAASRAMSASDEWGYFWYNLGTALGACGSELLRWGSFRWPLAVLLRLSSFGPKRRFMTAEISQQLRILRALNW